MAATYTSTSTGNGSRQFLVTILPDPSERHSQSQWAAHVVRWLRYRYLWSFYDQSAYSGFMAALVKRELGLYRNIRPILNSVTRLVEFHVTHNMGGRLDRDAGDGSRRPTALPIIRGKKASPKLQPCIARLWADSHWQTQKSSYVRFGTALGDVGLELVDDHKLGKIRLRVIHPAEIKSATLDPYGNVTSISLERYVTDPRSSDGDTDCLYREDISQVDEKTVHYETFLDGASYAWPGTLGDKWDIKLPFVPVRLVQHIDQGFPWGIAEPSGAILKSIEQDDQGSNLSDSNRRAVNGPWFLTGAELAADGPASTPYQPDPFGPAESRFENEFQIHTAQISSRADMSIMQCKDPSAKMTPLSFPVPVDAVCSFIDRLKDAVGLDYPELEIDMATASGDASGRALRVARQKVTAKIEERRAAYEDCLTWAQMAACVLGGIREYEGYEEFTVESMGDGKVDHHIGERAVFQSDAMEVIEIATARATALKTHVEAGFTLRSAMTILDFEPADIDSYESMRQAEEQATDARAAKRAVQDAVKKAETPTGSGLAPQASAPPPEPDAAAA